MNPDESVPDRVSTNEPSPSEALPRRRSRWPSLLILVGGLLGLAPLARFWPHDHQVDFRFEDGNGDVTRFDVEWTRGDGAGSGDALNNSSRSFEPGRAPKIVNMNVHLPNGLYVLDIRIERGDRVDVIQQHVTLGDADRIAIPLRAESMRP